MGGFQSDNDPGQRNCPRLSYPSEGEGEDGEYLRSSLIGIGCQQTPVLLPPSSTRRASTSTSTSTSPSPSSPARKRPRASRPTHGSAPSRNRQAAIDQVEEIRAKLSLCRVNRDRPKDLVCPLKDCQYEQLNGRMPELRRHIRTHIRKYGEIRCKGVSWQDFVRHAHLFPKISVDEQPYAVPEEDGLWIGGCLKTFSRADALKRHLRNTSCVGLNHN
jgi:hypothetical protein